MRIQSILILGCGYVGERLGGACLKAGMQVFGTTRSSERAGQLEAVGIEPLLTEPDSIPAEILSRSQAVLDSIPLTREAGDMSASQPVWLPRLAPKLSAIRWAGYLSTTGVYGDADGAWVDESRKCNPTSQRGRERLKAEAAWLASGLPAEVLRLAGIYGPGRNIIPRLMAGGYKAVRWQPPHYSARIHVDDIVAAIMAAMDRPRSGRIVNLADDEPLPHVDYVSELARIIGAPAPVILSADEGERQLSPAALDFFRDNKRVSNRLLHAELLPELSYPNFRDAVDSLTGD
ncbi:MAG: SDR family oxidoreductase [Mariprofundaceae bacterium]